MRMPLMHIKGSIDDSVVIREARTKIAQQCLVWCGRVSSITHLLRSAPFVSLPTELINYESLPRTTTLGALSASEANHLSQIKLE